MYLCKMITGIYTITNIINNKIYVGKSKNIKYRFTEHLKCLENNKHHNIYLQNAFNKYGKEAFKLEILEECDITFIFSQENYWCNLLNTHNRSFGYNIRPTNPYNNCKISKESKIKMSVNKHFNAKVRGYYYTKETVEKACIKRRKAILQYDLEMNFIKEWDSSKKAGQELNIDNSSITKCCKNKINFNTSGGFKWKYKKLELS